MASCNDVYGFLVGVTNRNVTNPLPPADLDLLTRLNLVQTITSDQYADLTKQVAALQQPRDDIRQETAQRWQLADQVAADEEQTRSVLFLFEGKNKKAAALEKAAQDRAALQATDADLAAKQQVLDDLVAKKSALDTMASYGGAYVALSAIGMSALRELGVRMYRVSDMPFQEYWTQSQQIDRDLAVLAERSATFVAGLTPSLPAVDRGHLWSIAIGLGGAPADPSVAIPRFVDAYGRLGKLTTNDENRLLAAEIVTSLPRDVPESVVELEGLQKDVRKLGVPGESSAGVAATLLYGQRADATYATASLSNFLRVTKSYEAAAILGIVNQPFDGLSQKFLALRQTFGSWGFAESDDVELASAYLSISELPIQGINTKLAIISKGVATYLQYPLVAAAVLASIPVLEANETLHLLEQAYDVIGRRAMPLSQPELITLAVRMIHGVRNETLAKLDTTAAAPPPAPVGYRGPFGGFGVPMFVFYGAYFSTFSAFGGVHPGHAHFGPGGGAGGMVG
ncbi:MAG TPA: hypothetical protein VGP88_07360 [Thermoplasmata archaeon]|jgi:hypothetical protein|nr:hypothetical protein [Thermoplasmata archaeon]